MKSVMTKCIAIWVKALGFMFDIMESKLELVVRLNSISQLDFAVSADFKEFRVEEVSDCLLSKYHEKASVVLLDEELVEVFSVVSKLFTSEPSIEDLRIQVASVIPKEHVQGTMLFSEELVQGSYRSSWVSQDFKRCILALVEDCMIPNGLVKAYVFG